MENWQCVVYPASTEELLTNPGIGFTAAPPLMGEPAVVCDSRGNPVEKYRFTPDSKTLNHPDSGVLYAGEFWFRLEPEEGRFCWDGLDEKLKKAREMGCALIIRCEPYALREDIPGWLRERHPDEPEFPFWRIDPNTTDYVDCWARFVRAFGERYDGNPLISSVDMALVGAWGEGGGSELVEPEKLDTIIRAYLDGFRRTPLQMLLHDPVSVGCIRGYRRSVGFRVDCLGDMGGFHGTEWSHMLDFYPENIENFSMRDAWREAPILFEACWHMSDWYLAGWDIDYIIGESLKWHISSYNGKQTAVPIEWRDSVARWVRKMGYRFELRRFRARAESRELTVELLLANVGVAPCYHAYPVTLRLTGQGRGLDLLLREDIRRWMPEEDVLVCERVLLPAELPEGEYSLSVGIVPPAEGLEPLRLAIGGRGEDGFYPMGSIKLEKGSV